MKEKFLQIQRRAGLKLSDEQKTAFHLCCMLLVAFNLVDFYHQTPYNMGIVKQQETAMKLQTNGRGLWSNQAQTVEITGFKLGYVNNKGTFGELRVVFDTQSWDVDQQGLIYTDPLFLKMLQNTLDALGLFGADVEYSEQGMQGRNYVSLDVGKEFLDSCAARYNGDLSGLIPGSEPVVEYYR